MRWHWCAQCDLFTRLSPEDGDDKLSVMALRDESVQVLKEVHERIHAYLILRPGPLRGNDPLFATTVSYDRAGKASHRQESRSPPARFIESFWKTCRWLASRSQGLWSIGSPFQRRSLPYSMMQIRHACRI